MACRIGAAVILALLVPGGPALAQSITAETDVTVGSSSQGVQAAATKLRAFGELPAHWRFYIDATLVTRRGPESDVFGAAYPYEPGLTPMEAYVERTEVSDGWLIGARIGRYRTPFGIYDRSDYGYTGLVRAPLIRYSEYWALSNNYMETGASLIAGTTWLSVEGSVGVATDEDKYARPGGANGVIRVQGAFGPLIVGASHIRTRPSREFAFASGRTTFTGVDARWMQAGVQLRGEWLSGQPFDRAETRGGYVEVHVHRRAMGPVTAVARLERLNYLAGPFSRFPAGTRWVRRSGGRANSWSRPTSSINPRMCPASTGTRHSTSRSPTPFEGADRASGTRDGVAVLGVRKTAKQDLAQAGVGVARDALSQSDR